jgi:hypothetical protein
VGVGRRTERRRTAAKNLGSGLELGVHLKTDDGFKFQSPMGFVQSPFRLAALCVAAADMQTSRRGIARLELGLRAKLPERLRVTLHLKDFCQ